MYADCRVFIVQLKDSKVCSSRCLKHVTNVATDATTTLPSNQRFNSVQFVCMLKNWFCLPSVIKGQRRLNRGFTEPAKTTPCCAELKFGDIHFNIISQHSTFFVETKCTFILHIQYHKCWLPVDARDTCSVIVSVITVTNGKIARIVSMG